jgi:hypothetical protein
MSGLKVKVLEAPIFEGVAQDLVLKSNNVNRIVIANTGPVSIQSNLSYSGTLTGNTGIINIGSGQIYKDASGNVGIGTSTPIYKLHVTNSAAANSNTDIIGVTSNYFTNAKKSLTWFTGTDAVGRISTVYNTISGEVGIDMTFGSLYNLAAGMNDSELMRLTSGGRLGIGTPLPDSLLTVNGVASFAAGSAGFPSIARAGDLNTGIFFPAADTIAFTEGGVESMRIDDSGNVGIGVTPTSKLDINGSAGAANRSLKIKPSANGADIPNLRTVFIEHASNDGALSLGFSTSTDAWAISSTYGSTGAYKPLVFATSDLERMRIDSTGNLGIGTSSPNVDYKLHVAGNILATGTVRIEGANIRVSSGGSAALPSIQPGEDADTGMYWGGSNTIGFSTGGTRRAEITSEGVLLTFANSSANYGIYMANANASPLGIRSTYTGAAPNGTGNVFYLASDTAGTKFTVRSNGGIANFQANDANLSDRREKKDFEPCGNYLEKLCQIPVQKFRYLNQAPEDDGLSIGVVAQDVQTVFPELVMESDWSNGEEGSEPKMRLSIYQTDLQYVMMKCIQELTARLEVLENK